MQLIEYLKTMRLSHAEFAKEMRVSAVTINRYVNGKRTPGFQMIRRIETATGGNVNVGDWYSPTKESAQPEQSNDS